MMKMTNGAVTNCILKILSTIEELQQSGELSFYSLKYKVALLFNCNDNYQQFAY